MKLEDHERRKFSVYCLHMADMEQRYLDAKRKLFEKQGLKQELVTQITKRDLLLIAAYQIVSDELKKWDEAETISAKDVGNITDL